jgi:multidrug efflux pump subunit AcrB
LIVLPFAVFGDVAGFEFLHPAAVTILGSLVTSTIITLFIIPAMYLHLRTKAAKASVLRPEIA